MTFFGKNLTYAIVGASNNKSKFGFKIVQALKDNGYKVIPINPRDEEICDLKAYKSISDVEDEIDVVNMVVPPKISQSVIEKEIVDRKMKVWFQPGTYEEDTIEFCEKNNVEIVTGYCLLLSAQNGKIM